MYIGEIRAFAFGYVPDGWLACNGQEIIIDNQEESEYTNLYSLIYLSSSPTLFVNVAVTSRGFKLPDLRGRTLVHFGQGPALSEIPLIDSHGAEDVGLTIGNLPAHTHTAQLYAEGATATSSNPSGNMLGGSAVIYANSGSSANKALGSESVALDPTGNVVTRDSGKYLLGESFGIRDPYLGVNFCIAYAGIYPSTPE